MRSSPWNFNVNTTLIMYEEMQNLASDYKLLSNLDGIHFRNHLSLVINKTCLISPVYISKYTNIEKYLNNHALLLTQIVGVLNGLDFHFNDCISNSFQIYPDCNTKHLRFSRHTSVLHLCIQ